MDLKDFSKEELISILEIIERARNCSGRSHLKEIMLKAKELVCADKAICGIGKVSDGDMTEVVTVVNGNYPEGWLNRYTSEKLYLTDPIVKYHTRFSTTRFWDEIFKISKSRQERLAIEHASDFGLRHGISSSIYDPVNENIGIFAFGGDKDRFVPHHKKIIDILTLHLNNALFRTKDKLLLRAGSVPSRTMNLD
jgi:hypothetical protein